jgi:hypothetical protein
MYVLHSIIKIGRKKSKIKKITATNEPIGKLMWIVEGIVITKIPRNLNNLAFFFKLKEILCR